MITFQKEESPSASGSGAGSVRNENSFQIAGHRILEVSIRRALKLRHYEHGIQAPMPTKILLLGKMHLFFIQLISKKNIVNPSCWKFYVQISRNDAFFKV